ncbi:MAG: hypothetical protein HON47_00875 [Candidatus Diapherotrites archaeon]|jgi:hypothetical protein|uniref:Uncharacterized protein n=1 Tax=Candidatus Iainarchaeum sp. TaxID=3101447 RepID=A0A8T5GE61_9ARCH|nr:hypothetical protein [Candidatus Diapherotrites archaeon]MBT7240944.1 hypothetical protein [Candidatus Diapherotrites archaeon]
MNSKGQHFSVFELLIAAIVAVAILYVLLQIIPTDPIIDNEAVSAISNSLSAVKAGGNTYTTDFKLKANSMVNSKNFEGFDSQSIVFDVGNLSNNIEVGVSSDGAWTYAKSTKSTEVNAKANVFCEINGSSLNDTLEVAGIEPQIDPITLCGEEEYRCCLVHIERA